MIAVQLILCLSITVIATKNKKQKKPNAWKSPVKYLHILGTRCVSLQDFRKILKDYILSLLLISSWALDRHHIIGHYANITH